MEELEITTSQPAEVETVEVALTDTGPTYSKGMEAVPGRLKTSEHRRGYTAIYKKCMRCLTEAVDTDTEKVTNCKLCNHSEFRVYDKLEGDVVEDVINNKLHYKCRQCGRSYDQPTACCIDNFRGNLKEYGKYYQGFMCSGCKTIYDYKVDCCSGASMISGKYMPAHNELKIALGL